MLKSNKVVLIGAQILVHAHVVFNILWLKSLSLGSIAST